MNPVVPASGIQGNACHGKHENRLKENTSKKKSGKNPARPRQTGLAQRQLKKPVLLPGTVFFTATAVSQP